MKCFTVKKNSTTGSEKKYREKKSERFLKKQTPLTSEYSIDR